MKLFGAIEAGGTKFVCAIGNENGEISKKIVIQTTTPEETMPQVINYFNDIHKETPLSAIGIGAFGPIDPDPKSIHYGYITTTPKVAWQQFNFVGHMQQYFNIPIGFDTDVNGAALGEHRWGAAQNIDTFIYITVGTGIGVGGMLSGNLMHGLVHPEMGHILIPHDKKIDPYKGFCPYHHNCLEGLAAGPAIMARWNVKSALDLPEDHKAWDLEAHYLALGLANYILTLSPKKIIMGGGVMRQEHLLQKIHPKVQSLLGGYVKHKTIIEHIEDYIVLPGLGQNAGICGAVALAQNA